MKKSKNLSLVVLALGLAAVPSAQSAQTEEDAIALVRTVIKADREAAVAQSLQLTQAESEKFWPLYHQYRAEMNKVGDGLVKLIKEYAANYPEVPDERARQMLKELAELEKSKLSTRTSYLKKFGKVLPAPKNLRFAQVENRLDLALQLELASNIPLVPIEGRMLGDMTGAAVMAEGVPGGVVVQTYEWTATVAAVDKATRKVTLVSPEGIKKTVKAGPEVINFDQIRVGDQLKITATEELAVYVAGEDEAPAAGSATVVALAPKGAKPGGVMAETTQVTAKVTAIDAEHRKATLQFEDGSTRTVSVRPDIDLAKRKVGDKVVIRTTESVALRVGKP